MSSYIVDCGKWPFGIDRKTETGEAPLESLIAQSCAKKPEECEGMTIPSHLQPVYESCGILPKWTSRLATEPIDVLRQRLITECTDFYAKGYAHMPTCDFVDMGDGSQPYCDARIKECRQDFASMGRGRTMEQYLDVCLEESCRSFVQGQTQPATEDGVNNSNMEADSATPSPNPSGTGGSSTD